MRLSYLIILIFLFPVSLVSQGTDDLVFYQVDTWDTNDQTWRPSIRNVSDFNNNDERISYRSYWMPNDSEDWFLNFEVQYEYNTEYYKRSRYYYEFDGSYSSWITKNDNDSSQLIYEEQLNHEPNRDMYKTERRITEYSGNGSYSRRFEYLDTLSNQWMYLYTNHFTISSDQDGCIIEELLEREQSPISKTTYVNNNACEPLVKTEFFWDYDTQDWANHALDSFVYTQNLTKQIHYNWSGFDDDWVLSYSVTSGTSEPQWREYMSFNSQGGGDLNRQEYDQDGNTVYAVSKYKASAIQEWNFEYEETNSYNMNNQLLQSTRKEIYIDSLDTWERVVEINHYYNDQGYIEETETSITILEPDQTINQINYSWVNEYSFYCNDLRKERIEYLDSEYHWRYKYGYKKTADCRDIIASELIVYPNPATDFILIQAPDFEDSDYMIDIYNSQGQVAFTKAFQNNSSFHHLDISPLNTGIYFISIISNQGNEISSTRIYKN